MYRGRDVELKDVAIGLSLACSWLQKYFNSKGIYLSPLNESISSKLIQEIKKKSKKGKRRKK